MRPLLVLAFAALFAVAGVLPVRAQEASLAGTVTDDTMSVLSGATITASDLASGAQFTATTNDKGQYRLPTVPPGSYRLQAELSGFSTVVLPRVELLVGRHATLSFTLKLAQVSETVTVTGEPPLVDTSSSQVAGNVDRRQMEELPLQGRNWMELSKLVKGITANDVTNTPGVSRDDDFQLNLDGQQITQRIAGSLSGQPRFSRESIAEFQIVTNLFDITQGRSTGILVQAITRSGANTPSGSVYGFFRGDELNAPDAVANRVLPYSNQQVGAALGGPIVRDRAHIFVTYEYEREPGTYFSSPSGLPGQSFTIPYKNTQKSFLARVDYEMSQRNRLTVRGSRWDWGNPFVLAAGGHPSNGSDQTKNATNILGIWNRVVSSNRVQEVRLGYNNFDWTNNPLEGLGDTIEYDFPGGLNIGKPYNYPQLFHQNNFESRYDLHWHRSAHDLKIGGEFLYIKHTGTWFIQRAGRMTFTSIPSDLSQRIPAREWDNPSAWNLAGLDPFVQRFDINYHPSDWGIHIPRPTWAVWIGDTWRLNDRLTANYGVRWDDDWGVASPPGVVTSTIVINNGSSAAPTDIPRMSNSDFGYKSGIRDHTNVAPRAGVTWNVNGSNDLVVRGGSGLYFTTPVSNMTFSPQIYSQMITATFPNDNQPGFVLDPTRGATGDDFFSGRKPLPAQSPRIIDPGYHNPYTWQSGIGFQKQINGVTSFEADLVHWNEYRDTRTIDPNLFYDPVTGYNRPTGSSRPNSAYGQTTYFVSTGHRDSTLLSMALNRRFRNNFQGGLTYAHMFALHDDGVIGYTAPAQNNQFDYLDGEYATSTDFQRHTLRGWMMYRFPFAFSTSLSYFYGSGNRFAATIPVAVYGKPGTNRLNLTASGAATASITIPITTTLANGDVIDIASRFDGPATIASGTVIPRDALKGLPLHKVDLRLTQDIKIAGSIKLSLIAEVYNLFNHHNYGSYNTSLSATSAAVTAAFGSPQQNTGNAYVPREAQLAFRLAF